jgi:hypothetical protein
VRERVGRSGAETRAAAASPAGAAPRGTHGKPARALGVKIRYSCKVKHLEPVCEKIRLPQPQHFWSTWSAVAAQWLKPLPPPDPVYRIGSRSANDYFLNR